MQSLVDVLAQSQAALTNIQEATLQTQSQLEAVRLQGDQIGQAIVEQRVQMSQFQQKVSNIDKDGQDMMAKTSEHMEELKNLRADAGVAFNDLRVRQVSAAQQLDEERRQAETQFNLKIKRVVAGADKELKEHEETIIQLASSGGIKVESKKKKLVKTT